MQLDMFGWHYLSLDLKTLANFFVLIYIYIYLFEQGQCDNKLVKSEGLNIWTQIYQK